MLDLGGIPAVLEIRNGGYLELRDLLLKNIASEQDLKKPDFMSYIRPNFTRVSGMLSWPSFYAEAGASYGIYNTTQYFWSNTIFYRGDCDWQNPVTPPDGQKVSCVLSLIRAACQSCAPSRSPVHNGQPKDVVCILTCLSCWSVFLSFSCVNGVAPYIGCTP